MRRIGNILLTLLVAVLCATQSGCIREQMTAVDKEWDSILLNIGTKAYEQDNEDKIFSLRLYAFVKGELAGYYYNPDGAGLPNSVLVDLTICSTSTQEVTFYVIANEGAVQGLSETLSDKTTPAQLDALYFTDYTAVDASNGLPMAFKDTFTIDVASDNVGDAASTGAINADEHAGHTVLNQKIEIELERCVAKLDLFVAKANGEEGVLKIESAKMHNAGTQMRNYVMPADEATLKAINSRPADLDLSLDADAVINDFPYAETYANYTSERKEAANYTYVLTEPFYPFENPYGTPAGDAYDWSTESENGYDNEGEYRGHILEITYRFDNNEARTGMVYLPKVERNTYYAIYCLINNEGKIIIDYLVKDWIQDENDSWTFDFQYPTYENPVLPYGGSTGSEEDIKAMYPDGPTCYYTGVDVTDPEAVLKDPGTFKVTFKMTEPSGMLWSPTLPKTAGADYEVRVYSLARKEVTQPVEAGPDAYIVCVIPLNSNYASDENTTYSVALGITYTPEWTGSSEYLQINGKDGDIKWGEGTGEDAPYIISIKQIDRPTTGE